MKVIALIDCNNFFVGCEELFNPTLRGKAVCVLSSNDGCIIARSNEAKKLGITMGMPFFIAKKQFKNVIYLSGNHKLYNEMSSRVMRKLYDYTPNVQVYSIDEAFLELSGVRKIYRTSYEKIAERIKSEIKNEIGIDVSIGLSYSKTLAKLASNKAKLASNFECEKFPTGLYKIGFHEIENELSQTKIEEIWGIGQNSAALLRKFLIKNAFDFTRQNDAWLKRVMGKTALELKQELLGNSINPVVSGSSLPKSIQKTASFPKFSSDKNYIKNALNFHSHRVCRKLRKHGLTGQILTVMLRTKDFKIYSEKVVLEISTNSEFEINKIAFDILEKIYNPRILYRSCGITVSKLNCTTNFQLPLLGQYEHNSAKKISAAWDVIENKFGTNKLHLGANAIRST